MEPYFSDVFGVDPDTIESYGALNVCIASDLPAFIDPFLLFNSESAEYQALHAEIIEYLIFLRDRAGDQLDPATIRNLYAFPEVKQNWLGYTLFGNGGRGLGPKFAKALHASLGTILHNFGEEDVTEASHLEKLTLIQPGVGRDNISDFCTNLIKHYLLEYTEEFAQAYMKNEDCKQIQVVRAKFNYATETWMTKSYFLPYYNRDYILITPLDMLTRDENWINHSDMIDSFDLLPDALPDDQLRAQVNRYFLQQLPRRPKAKDREAAAHQTILQFPELIDYYIKLKEETGEQAVRQSSKKMEALQSSLVRQVQAAIADLVERSEFYDKPWTSYDECKARVLDFKNYVENNDGYRLINRKDLRSADESMVQLFFGLLWCRNEFDVNREPNNGRGPVDFKVSYGSGDKSLIEFKLASNTQLKRNLQKQVEIYEAANGTRTSVKAIVVYTKQDERRVNQILKELKLESEESVIVIDARNDNKPSASKA
jgi:hypothetical protein